MYLRDHFDSLKGRDQALGNYLDRANQTLPEDEQFDFYLVKYDPFVIEDNSEDEEGTISMVLCRISVIYTRTMGYSRNSLYPLF